jgi:GT2 family glycosyltransferase
LKNTSNEGWSGGNNRGIEIALQEGADWILLLNNDTVVSPKLLEVLAESSKTGTFGLLGPVINEFDRREVVQTEGVRFNPIGQNEFFARIPIADQGSSQSKITEVDIVNGCAVAVSRAVFEKIGLIDERFFLICEESDLCLRAQAAGFKLGMINETLVWHKHSVSFARAAKPLQRYYGTRNLGLLLRKHPVGPERRGRFISLMAYWRLSYHLYCHEIELNNRSGAHAVANGLADSLLGRFGQWSEKTSLIGISIGLLFSCISIGHNLLRSMHKFVPSTNKHRINI